MKANQITLIIITTTQILSHLWMLVIVFFRNFVTFNYIKFVIHKIVKGIFSWFNETINNFVFWSTFCRIRNWIWSKVITILFLYIKLVLCKSLSFILLLESEGESGKGLTIGFYLSEMYWINSKNFGMKVFKGSLWWSVNFPLYQLLKPSLPLLLESPGWDLAKLYYFSIQINISH